MKDYFKSYIRLLSNLSPDDEAYDVISHLVVEKIIKGSDRRVMHNVMRDIETDYIELEIELIRKKEQLKELDKMRDEVKNFL